MDFLIIVGIVVSMFVFIFCAGELSDRGQMHKRKLAAMNELYHCSGCHRYSRDYYIKLKEDCDQSYEEKKQKFLTEYKESVYYMDRFCPHCEEHLAKNSHVQQSWIGKHPDAPIVRKKDIKIIENTRELASIITYESTVKSTDRSLELGVLFDDLLLNLSVKRGKE